MATDRTERLLNLVICLLGAKRPVSRAALREGIPGYGDAASDEAFERMFERDKDELRQMGIPIDTVVNVQGEVEGYLIDEDAYAMPDMDFDPAERAVLGLAARVWSEAALTAEAGAALRKLEAATGDRWSPLLPGRPGTGEEALPLLWEAIRSRTVVRFPYLARGREIVEERTVEPWATAYRGGAWYLIGRSRERDAGRAFRLSRIRGSVTRTREQFPAADRVDIERLLDELVDPETKGTARISLPDHGAARLRALARQRGDGTWEVDYTDLGILVAEVIEAGGMLVEPGSAADDQRRALLTVAQVHGEPHA
jgi:predicted DNA-binding transcriptional regulator YafY